MSRQPDARSARVARGAWVALSAAAVAVLTACAPSASSTAPSVTSSTGPSSAVPVTGCPAIVPPSADTAFDEALHDELVAMLERDQAGRLGTGSDDEGDATRTQRLREILAVHGWPSFALVGDDGEDAAWAIAQHSDLDPEFQACALEHLRVAVEAGQASPGNLAYLEDRIAAASGEPQRYGTQVACGPDGPVPAVPLVDDARIDEFRADADLPPFADYLAEMAEICAGVPEGGSG